MELLPSQRAEIAALSRRFGEPLRIDATIHDDFFDPIRRPDRVGEVCMVVRRPNGKLLLSIKTFYPRGAYRLPTGGVDHGEPILDALLREISVQGATLWDVRTQILGLVVWIVLGFLLAVRLFRFERF